MIDKLELLVIIIPVLIVSLVLHELAHAIVGTRLGDPTPRAEGRLTLNPLRHLDPLGTAMFFISFLIFSFPFGWAKPVSIDTRNLKHPQRDMALVAVAGPLVNLTIATLLTAAAIHVPAVRETFDSVGGGSTFAARALGMAIYLNMVLFVFNLLPIPPLDGSRIVAAFMPRDLYRAWSSLDQYGFLILGGMFLILGSQFSALLQTGLAFTSTHIIGPLVGA